MNITIMCTGILTGVLGVSYIVLIVAVLKTKYSLSREKKLCIKKKPKYQKQQQLLKASSTAKPKTSKEK